MNRCKIRLPEQFYFVARYEVFKEVKIQRTATLHDVTIQQTPTLNLECL